MPVICTHDLLQLPVGVLDNLEIVLIATCKWSLRSTQGCTSYDFGCT